MNKITDEQRTAWSNLMGYYPSAAHVIALLLPSELTNPQSVMPTEPGLYLDKTGESGPIWRLEREGGRLYVSGTMMTATSDRAPFTRLVAERADITRGKVIAVLDSHSIKYDVEAISDLVSLANGTDRD